jgi:beta-glucosidase
LKFLWGAATSSHQIEGGNQDNDWWAWEHEGRVEGGVRSGIATDHWHRMKEDLKYASEMGLTSYRFSIEWSRFEPREGEWREEAFDWYLALISECERLRLLPMLTLHHFTSPKWFAEQGGFSHPRSPERFQKFVEKIALRFGSRIPLWCTFNEPMVLVAGTYLGQFMPNGSFNPKAASQACFNLLRAHVLAYETLHRFARKREGPWRDHPLMVGFAHNMLDLMPDRRLHLLEILLAREISRLYNSSWLDAVCGKPQHFGLLGVMPKAPQFQEVRGKKTADFIGVNYYTKGLVQWGPRSRPQEQGPEIPISVRFARRREVTSDLGWSLHPEGLGKILRSIAGYGLPIFITENGIADRTDQLRKTYLCSHLEEVARACDDGIDIRGYYHWSLLDNFEWIKGFWPRFGLLGVDYDTLERKVLPSAVLYRDIILAHDKERAPNAEILRSLTKT